MILALISRVHIIFLLLLLPINVVFAQLPDNDAGIIIDEPTVSFEQHLEKINVSSAFFDNLRVRPDSGPTINLNLLRYRPRNDNTRYNLYGKVARKDINQLGGYVLVVGSVLHDSSISSTDWDAAGLVLFPEASDYLRLQQSPRYQSGVPDRVAGTYERMLYLLSDGEQILL